MSEKRKWKQYYEDIKEEYCELVKERNALTAQLAEARSALGKELAWMESDKGPLYADWEDANIAAWDNVEWEWPETLKAIKETDQDLWTGEYRSDNGNVRRYRELAKALSLTPVDALKRQEAERRVVEAAKEWDKTTNQYWATRDHMDRISKEAADESLVLAVTALAALQEVSTRDRQPD
jgi:hypothetical protein